MQLNSVLPKRIEICPTILTKDERGQVPNGRYASPPIGNELKNISYDSRSRTLVNSAGNLFLMNSAESNFRVNSAESRAVEFSSTEYT